MLQTEDLLDVLDLDIGTDLGGIGLPYVQELTPATTNCKRSQQTASLTHIKGSHLTFKHSFLSTLLAHHLLPYSDEILQAPSLLNECALT